MPEPRHLKNAPITEALVDFRVAPAVELPQMTVAHEQIRDRYPLTEERNLFEGEVRLAEGKLKANTKSLGLHGYFFRTEDKVTVVQFRNDGFTLNRLKPYTKWEEVFPEAMRLWDVYIQLSGVKSVARLALRYINHLRLPLSEGDDFSKYLLAPVEVPERIPQSVSEFRTRYTAHDNELKISVHVTQRLKSGEPHILLLDIDAFKMGPFRPDDKAEIERSLEALHDLKNRVFFNMVNEECLQLFQ